MENINKAIILCGGYATRFLPQCKAVPKELLPLFNTPILQFLVDDLINNGVTKIIFVIRKGKEIILSHFLKNKKWESMVKNTAILSHFNKYNNIQFKYCYQKNPNGTGGALLCAKKHCNTPFYLLNGDEIIYSKISLITQLKNAYLKHNNCVLATQKVDLIDAKKYGMLSMENNNKILKIIEKPQDTPPSLYSNLGAYVLTPEFMRFFPKQYKGELPITDVINTYCKAKNMFGVEIVGQRFDMGNPLSYVFSNVKYCYLNNQTHLDTKNFLTNLLKE